MGFHEPFYPAIYGSPGASPSARQRALTWRRRECGCGWAAVAAARSPARVGGQARADVAGPGYLGARLWQYAETSCCGGYIVDLEESTTAWSEEFNMVNFHF